MKRKIGSLGTFACLAMLLGVILITTPPISPASAQRGWRFLGIEKNTKVLKCRPPYELLDWAPGKPRHVLYTVWRTGLVGLVDLWWDEPQIDPISGTVAIPIYAVRLRGTGMSGVRIGGVGKINGGAGPGLGEALLKGASQKAATLRWEAGKTAGWIRSFSIQFYIGDGSQCAEDFIARYNWTR
jgi:hypothetical protein